MFTWYQTYQIKPLWSKLLGLNGLNELNCVHVLNSATHAYCFKNQPHQIFQALQLQAGFIVVGFLL